MIITTSQVSHGIIIQEVSMFEVSPKGNIKQEERQLLSSKTTAILGFPVIFHAANFITWMDNLVFITVKFYYLFQIIILDQLYPV